MNTSQLVFPRGLLSKSANAIVFLWFFLALPATTISVRGAKTNSLAPKVEWVAPGVWRIRFGNPEEFTPTHFRSAPADVAGLEAKSAS
ncbi:MAG: hypothetical protein ACREFE_11675, partial [Limisphaerales bacterium]